MTRVRAATADDDDVIHSVEQAAAHRPWSRSDIVAHLADPTRRSWLAEGADGTVLGHVLATVVLDEGELLSIAVHPSARRRGVGRVLLATLVRNWAAEGVRTGWLEVRVDNVAAVGMYRQDGWQDTGRRKGYYHDGVDALVMRREVC